ncbi:phosphate ABC transporter permease subunit PstC [archaeon]|jgi:phosphate transport system permease protein|nr:phosphate ABC transporter permease subunit PstC [archaeon]
MNEDEVFYLFSLAVASISLLLLALILVVLVQYTLPVIKEMGFDYFITSSWNPVFGKERYGILPYFLGTVLTSFIAVLVGVPISFGIALFLTEYSNKTLKKYLSIMIDLLAAIPSVIYGLWGFFVFRNFILDYIEKPLHNYFGKISIFSATPTGLDFLSGGLILAIMIIPIVSSVTREVLELVPTEIKEGIYAIGGNRYDVIVYGSIRYSKNGILGAILLGLGRAVGETMAVSMVIGNATGENALPRSLFSAGQTLSSLIANEFNEANPTSLHPNALVGAGLVLLMMAIVVNLGARAIVSKYKR